MAATIREQLGIDVEEAPGAYGEFTVLVDGKPIRRGNPVAVAFAMLPSAGEIVEAVRERLNPVKDDRQP